MRLFLFAVLLSFSGLLSAQNATDFDSRLTEVYEISYLQRLQANHPVMLQRLEYALDNGWFLTEFPTEKGDPAYPEITINDIGQINFLQLQHEEVVARDFEARTMYRIAGTNKILVCESGRKFTASFNEWRENR